jgi:cobalt-precorrin-5B (C1)-methyltransferase
LSSDLKDVIVPRPYKKGLRTGYTTGTCAAAATKAAMCTLIKREKLASIKVTLPKGGSALIRIAWINDNDENAVTAAVIKDAGDDPDVTDGAEICSTVSILERSMDIVIKGGNGVGIVTKPGLGLEIGKAAINKVPMSMIHQAVTEVKGSMQTNFGISVVISVSKGEEIAKKTDNPRLGILGGISILGTTGIVIPYSTSSFAASIRQSIDVSFAMKSFCVVLTTGGRSEDFARKLFHDDIPDHSYIQIGDFVGYSIRQCANKKIKKAIVAGFIGKLTKMAMGVKQTHVKGSHVDMDFLGHMASRCGAEDEIVTRIKTANTARHVAELIDNYGIQGFYDSLCNEVHDQLSSYCDHKVAIDVLMFDFDGKVIGSCYC